MINKKMIKEFIIKNMFPSLIIQILFITYIYIKTDYIAPFGSYDIILYLFILLGVIMFRSLLHYVRNEIGDIMQESIFNKIVSILIILGVIYLYIGK